MSSEWPRIEIGQVAKLRSGFPFKSADWKENGVPVIKIANVKGGRIIPDGCGFVSSEVAAKSAEWYTRPGDILIAMTGYVGEVAQAKPGESYLINQRVGRFDFLPNAEVEPTYFFYHLQHSDTRAEMEGVARGSAQPNLSAGDAHKIKITLPPLPVQREIAATLSSLDDRITLLRETNATLEAIAQALFKSWFVDFDPVCAKMEGRAPEGMDEATAALFPDSFEETELGAVPRGWTHSSLTDACSYISRGLSPKYLEEGDVLVLNQKCIRDFSVDYNKGRRHDVTQRKIDGRELAVGDVLVNSTGVGTLGRVAQVLELPEPAIVDSHVTVIRAGNRVSWPYLGQWLARAQPEIEAMGEGSTGQTELSRAKLGALSILVPSTDALAAFDAIVEPLKNRVALNEMSSKNLASLRDTLLPRLISGQLCLPETIETIDEALA